MGSFEWVRKTLVVVKNKVEAMTCPALSLAVGRHRRNIPRHAMSDTSFTKLGQDPSRRDRHINCYSLSLFRRYCYIFHAARVHDAFLYQHPFPNRFRRKQQGWVKLQFFILLKLSSKPPTPSAANKINSSSIDYTVQS